MPGILKVYIKLVELKYFAEHIYLRAFHYLVAENYWPHQLN